MKLVVPTVMCEALLLKDLTVEGKAYKTGEFIPMPYGLALQGRALGGFGTIKDELNKHVEAASAMAIYGGDCWFPQHLQTISHIADYLAKSGLQTETVQ